MAAAGRARDLVMRHGWNSTAYQLLNPGIDHWFSGNGEAVVGYIRRGGFLLVAGAPVCSLPTLLSVVREFEAFAAAHDCKVCYVCAAERMAELLGPSPDHSVVTIGAQPVWNPTEWPAVLAARPSLRAQLRRALNKGVQVKASPPAEGKNNPRLHETLRAWLDAQGLPPMGFLVEPETLEAGMPDRLLLIAWLAEDPVAYLVASPVAARNGFLIEQVVRSPRAPNGTSELLIDHAMRQFASEGREYATLGLVALATSVSAGIRKNPWWLAAMMMLARRHARRFYNFEGLERFRNKMSPKTWEKVYAISNESRFSPFALYAIGEAFSGISPWRAIAIALWRATQRNG